MNPASWSGELAEAEKDYFIAPKVNYKFEQLRQVTQQKPLNVTFEVEVDGEPAGEQHETLQVRSINDCPFAVANSEETLDDENFIAGSAELGWMFAAYVNENHPILNKILQEALETKIVGALLGLPDVADEKKPGELKNKEKLAAADPNFQWIDLAQTRGEGIMPIPYTAEK